VSGGIVGARRISGFRILTVLLSVLALLGATTSVVGATPKLPPPQRQKQAEKYEGKRNAQKRANNNKNNFVNDVVTGLAVVALVIVAVVVAAAFVSGVGEALTAIAAGLAALFAW